MGMYSQVTNNYSPRPCSACGEVEVKGQWWSLSGYFGISGYLCPKCYGKVSHDAYRRPNDPEGFNEIAVMMQLKRSNS